MCLKLRVTNVVRPLEPDTVSTVEGRNNRRRPFHPFHHRWNGLSFSGRKPRGSARKTEKL